MTHPSSRSRPAPPRKLPVPTKLHELARREPSAASWLDQLPVMLDDLSHQWGLELGCPFPDGSAAFVVPARRADECVVLKIQWPHDECGYEANALTVWIGDGAIRLLDHDADRRALLLERCLPGTAFIRSSAA